MVKTETKHKNPQRNAPYGGGMLRTVAECSVRQRNTIVRQRNVSYGGEKRLYGSEMVLYLVQRFSLWYGAFRSRFLPDSLRLNLYKIDF